MTDRRNARYRRTKLIPQFELPQPEEFFNLASEIATGGERFRREADAQAQAERRQAERQHNLP